MKSLDSKSDFTLYDASSKVLLPAFEKPLPDELLSSWLVRLSNNHGLNVHTFCNILWKGINVWNRDIDRSASDELLTSLASKTNCTYAEIKSTTLDSYSGNLFLSHSPNTTTEWILPLGIYHRFRRNKGLMYCPNCLLKDDKSPYFRKLWRLGFSIVCNECNCFLYDCCPWCKSGIMYFRTTIGREKHFSNAKNIRDCHRCGRRLSSRKYKVAPDNLVAIQNELYNIMNYGYNDRIIYPHQYFRVLHFLARLVSSSRNNIQSLQKEICESIDVDFVKRPGGFKNRFELQPYMSRVEVLQMAHWLLIDWPKRFTSICYKNKIWSSDLLRDFLNPPFWYEDVVRGNLFVSNINRKFKPLYS